MICKEWAHLNGVVIVKIETPHMFWRFSGHFRIQHFIVYCASEICLEPVEIQLFNSIIMVATFDCDRLCLCVHVYMQTEKKCYNHKIQVLQKNIPN